MPKQRQPKQPILSLGPGIFAATALKQQALAAGYKVHSVVWSSSVGASAVVEDPQGRKFTITGVMLVPDGSA